MGFKWGDIKMFSDLPSNFLYTAYKLVIEFSDNLGKSHFTQGTAFVIAISSDADDFIIVTNRHMVDPNYNAPAASYKNFNLKSIIATGRRNDDSLYRFSIDPKTSVYHSQDVLNDVAIFVKPLCKVIENMPTFELFYHFGLADIADKNFFHSELFPFDVVAFAGFPQEHDQLAERPLIRGGRIASDPKFDFSIGGKAAGQCVAYEAFAYGGSSGSPLYAPARGFSNSPNARVGRLIGINAGYLQNGTQHIGLSYFYRSTIILEILKENKIIG